MARAGGEKLKFVDLCAGLGGFHAAMSPMENTSGGRLAFECVLASELNPELRSLYIDNFPELRAAYEANFPVTRWRKDKQGLQRSLKDLADSLDIYDDHGKIVRIHGDLRGL